MNLTRTLCSGTRLPISQALDFQRLSIPLEGHKAAPGIKKRARVSPYTLLASHDDPAKGERYAPLPGTILAVEAHSIEIDCSPANGTAANKTDDSAAPLAQQASPLDLFALAAADLPPALKRLGLDPGRYAGSCTTLIINGLNPEPGVCFVDELFESQGEQLGQGLALLKKLTGAHSTVLCLPEKSRANLEGTVTRHIKAVYPANLDPLLIKAVTEKETPDGLKVIPALELFYLGLAAQSGLPPLKTLLSVQGKNMLVPLGALAGEILTVCELVPQEGDSLILGGAMRGRALADTSCGVWFWDQALLLLNDPRRARLEDNPCFNCGRCVQACPMRLRPNMLSRYAEFGLLAGCQKEYIQVCLDCGMCGYVCPARRPMRQYIADAKHALGLAESPKDSPNARFEENAPQ